MANILHIVAEAPEEQLSLYGAGALIRVESSATQAGAYAEVGTVALVAGTTLYTFIHSAGIAGDWYKVRYSTAVPTLPAHYSVYGDVFQGGVDTLICSLADARQRMGIASADTSQDENLLQYIRQAGDWIAKRTGRTFLPDPATGTTVYTFDVEDYTSTLYIPRGIRSISTLEVAGLTGGAYSTVTAGTYFIRPSEVERQPWEPGTRIELSDVGGSLWFYPGKDTVKVTGTFGFASVPPAIEKVALTLVIACVRESANSGGETVTVNIDGSRIYERALSYSDRQALDFYRDWLV